MIIKFIKSKNLQEEGKKLIREQSKNTVVKEKISEGKDITEARKEADELGKSNQEIVDQIDNVATLIAGLTSQPQEGEKTPFAAYEEILDIYIEELNDFSL